MIQGLRTAIYPVTNLDAACAWYSQVLGAAPYFKEAFYVGFNVHGFELGLIPDGHPGASGVQAYWGTADVAAEVERLLGLGATLETPATDVGGGIIVALVKDPDGNQFGLVHNPHFDATKLG